MKRASSSAAIIVCSCLEVPRFARKTSWLSCSIWCFPPYEDKIEVKELVKSLYTVLASAIGLWLGRIDGSPFLYSRTVKLVFQEIGFFLKQWMKKRNSNLWNIGGIVLSMELGMLSGLGALLFPRFLDQFRIWRV